MTTAKRRCSKCGKDQPEWFFACRNQCKDCKAAYMREYWAKRKQPAQPTQIVSAPPPKPAPAPAPKPEPSITADLRAALKPAPKPRDDDNDIPIASGPKQPPLPIPPTTNFRGDATAHERDMLQHGLNVASQCLRAHHALDVITSGWWAMNRGEA